MNKTLTLREDVLKLKEENIIELSFSIIIRGIFENELCEINTVKQT